MKSKYPPRPVREIVYARGAIRNLIEIDTTGEVPELEVAIAWLDAAENKMNEYIARRDQIDRLPKE